MARGFSCGVQCTIDLLQSSPFPGVQRPLSMWGKIMRSFSLLGEEWRARGGEVKEMMI